MKKLRSLTFIVVCLCFSAFITVASLYMSIELAGVNSFIADTNDRIDQLQTENEMLRVRLDSKLSLKLIDELAREKLGMRTAAPEQIFFAELQG